jgi:hypothetical protein
MTILFIFQHLKAGQILKNLASLLVSHARFDFQNVKSVNTSWEGV